MGRNVDMHNVIEYGYMFSLCAANALSERWLWLMRSGVTSTNGKVGGADCTSKYPWARY